MSLLKDAQRSYNQFKLDISAVYRDAVSREVDLLPLNDPFRAVAESVFFFDTKEWEDRENRFLRYFSFELSMKGGDMVDILKRETEAFAKHYVDDQSNALKSKNASWKIQGVK